VWTSARKSEGRSGKPQPRLATCNWSPAPATDLGGSLATGTGSVFATPVSMDRCDFISRISPGLACTVALLAGCLTNEGREQRIARSRIVDEGEATATIRFAKGEGEPAGHLPAYVDELVSGAASGSPKAVLVLGFANDHHDLNANLALAERRAQTIARELVTRGVPRDWIIVAGSETRPNDEGGSRVEVTIVPGSRIAMLPATSAADR
jgi:hypothetical protein